MDDQGKQINEDYFYLVSSEMEKEDMQGIRKYGQKLSAGKKCFYRRFSKTEWHKGSYYV